ncbi:hypothetical protein C4K25_0343 [Pseudomonas chlororaphis]|jgi:hypothetical protein|nr:hypothetical protein C4K27_0348 [Pseudomonas chlororaphis subsp. chlororaphis]AZD13302.1 hypothetical protein C4K25_0343 [Pseudomonas chlororaphis]
MSFGIDAYAQSMAVARLFSLILWIRSQLAATGCFFADLFL